MKKKTFKTGNLYLLSNEYGINIFQQDGYCCARAHGETEEECRKNAEIIKEAFENIGKREER